MNSGEKFIPTNKQVILYSTILFVVLVVSILVCLSIGTVSIPLKKIFSVIILNDDSDTTYYGILWDIRLPRIILAAAVGAGLSLCGAVFQALLKNPLAEPYILGISSGGAFGAILSLLLGLSFLGMQIFAFGGALVTIFLVFLLGKRFGEIDPNSLLLSGVMIGAFFSALILLMMSFIDQSLRSAFHWLIGNLTFADVRMLYVLIPILIVSSFILISFAHSYNLISIDEENAKQFGVNTKLVKNLSYLLASLIIGLIVSAVGIIGFVGLLIPHLCRLIFGFDNKIVLPTSILMGGIFLLWADLFSRTILSPSEI
ncbi:MAG: iron ABC transporter permease, partial [Ignavibacteria bacterium]|nr:iron ABC transporter permease [Ignavibacteria bacterium]